MTPRAPFLLLLALAASPALADAPRRGPPTPSPARAEAMQLVGQGRLERHLRDINEVLDSVADDLHVPGPFRTYCKVELDARVLQLAERGGPDAGPFTTSPEALGGPDGEHILRARAEYELAFVQLCYADVLARIAAGNAVLRAPAATQAVSGPAGSVPR